MTFESARRVIPWRIALVCLAGVALSGCGGRHIAAIPPGGNGTPTESAPSVSPASNPNGSSASTASRGAARPSEIPSGSFEQGLASWYGLPFHGRRSANGEIYDMNKLTAAHRTLPFDTIVRVTNLDNGLQTEVRITDRGPFVEDRCIDLSLAAARAIGMVGTGTARVRLDIVASDASNVSDAPNRGASAIANPPAPTGRPIATSASSSGNRATPAGPAIAPVAAGYFTVQVGAFGERANAEHLKQQLDGRYHPVSIQDFDGPNGRIYRVRVGSLPTEDAARDLAQKLTVRDGIHGMVVRQDEVATPGGDHQ